MFHGSDEKAVEKLSIMGYLATFLIIFVKPPGKRPHIELATVKELLLFRPLANGQRRKKARLVVGSCGQPPDKSLRLKFSATPHRVWAKEFIVWSFGERGRDPWRIDLEIDSRLDSRDRRRLRSQISARDSALVREFLDPVVSKPALGLIAPLESCNALEHSFRGSLESQ
ncbi:hypothetical protein AVEN_1002-1 [Araneus ventricosus]|uniref:Uncharacterized protein n=1 Tax=Araneus ventricosus TaxID=182803 RepID=A0A4Y2CWN5_ARAVE|nr:hypothetical protein AVEN_1002-1 [Araneus ventricosus]